MSNQSQFNSNPSWQRLPDALNDDQALIDAVLAVHTTLLADVVARDPLLNLALPIEQRALRRIDDWRVLLLLTPWMLARLLFPAQPPVNTLPANWSADERAPADYVVLGPRLAFTLLGQTQIAHLNYHVQLGHYLLQPLCLQLEAYADADAVFNDWGAVIQIRDTNLAHTQRDCPLQREISRRELFRRLKPTI